MKNIFRVFFLCHLFSLFPSMASGQVENLGEAIEKSAELVESSRDYTQVVEDLINLSRKPVNLNKAGEDEIDGIPFLSPMHRKMLYQYIQTYGELLSIYELVTIPGFDSTLIRKIQPYIAIEHIQKLPSPTPKNLLRFGRHDLILRYEQLLPKAKGYIADDSMKNENPGKYYPGGPQRYYFRYVYHWFDKITIGLSGEKDPGEQFFRGAQSLGMDFYAGYLSLSNVGIIKNIVIGNFRVSFGQGLTLGTGISFGSMPGVMLTNPVRGLRPGLSMNEEDYLRGVGISLKIKHVELSGFASYHPRDGTISQVDSLDLETASVSSFVNTGYHRTFNELVKKNALQELVCGGNVSFSMSPIANLGFKVGMTGAFCHYSAPLAPTFQPYNQFGFKGDQNTNMGIDLQFRYRYCYFFGEISGSANGGLACLAGINLTPDPRVGITLIGRNYEPRYQNTFSNAFGQNSINANEKGIYLALSASLLPKVTLSGYLDLFTFPWLRNRTDTPTHGQEYGVLINWQAAANIGINVRYYQKNISRNQANGPDMVVHKLAGYFTRDYRFNLLWDPVEGVILKSRVEWKETGERNGNKQKGFLIYQDIQLKPIKIPVTVTIRYALFDTPGYDSRIYVYEPEVLYGYSVPAYEGKGMRICAVLHAGINRHLDIWLRGGWIYYTDRDAIGNGMDQTRGNSRFEITGQVIVGL
ncbi:MAG: helix-hairpin-helix domain-containing protein [Bacteroidales bacterium]|nr:helix-hairpin-helix domain-containing protein [Bacteroidales bacterium]